MNIALILLLLCNLPLSPGEESSPPVPILDPDYDVVYHHNYTGVLNGYDPYEHHPINMLELSMGKWKPSMPEMDLFDGDYIPGGKFVKIELKLEGLVNPPGNAIEEYKPYKYGNHPVYGYVEIDIDADNSTGGEVTDPHHRYLGNIARFGGMPTGEVFADRVAKNGTSDFDNNLDTKPFVERHGEEFHLAFVADQFSKNDIDIVNGNSDTIFQSGEEWIITGKWFHRAHAFEPYSWVYGGYRDGEYSPNCPIKFHHDQNTDITTVTLIFPLTNVGAASVTGSIPETPDRDVSNQASIHEALSDLVDSASHAPPPANDSVAGLIIGWDGKNPNQYLNPANWRATVLLGTPHPHKIEKYIWTDAYPNVIRGDINGDGQTNLTDVTAVENFIQNHDLNDGCRDNTVRIPNFASNFSIYDINHNGILNSDDVALTSRIGDCDLDGDVDLADFSFWQLCVTTDTNGLPPDCPLSDLNNDGLVDNSDFRWFSAIMAGP